MGKTSYSLIEKRVIAAVGAGLWLTLRGQRAAAVRLAASELYLFHASSQLLHRVEHIFDAPEENTTIALDQPHLAARALRSGFALEPSIDGTIATIAVPVYTQHQPTDPAAVVLVPYHTASAQSPQEFAAALAACFPYIFPLREYGSLSQPTGWYEDDILLHGVSSAEQLLDIVMETACHTLGFSCAALSLLDEPSERLAVARVYGIPPDWQPDAHHPLKGYALREHAFLRGTSEWVGGWDDRFNPHIWRSHQHDCLARAWVALTSVRLLRNTTRLPSGDCIVPDNRLGVLEVGIDRSLHERISPLAVAVLEQFARDFTRAIQRAQPERFEEKTCSHTRALAELYHVSRSLQQSTDVIGEAQLLHEIAHKAHAVLSADVVELYPYNEDNGQFEATAVVVGQMRNPQQPAHPNTSQDNLIMHHVARHKEAYYQDDVRRDPLFQPLGEAATQPFTLRERITSLAALPLVARGRLLGVLCISYRRHRRFMPSDTHMFALFAQNAATTILIGQVVRYQDRLGREQERRRLARELHDTVKNTVRGLARFSRAASLHLPTDPSRTQEYLHEIRRGCWNIISDINLILDDLLPTGHNSHTLGESIRATLGSVVGQNAQQWAKISIDVDKLPPKLHPMNTRVLLAVIREGVSNALDYADAAAIRIYVTCEAGRCRLVIEDDGRGFDPAKKIDTTHRGLRFMREQIEELGGTMELTSPVWHNGRAHGTRLAFELPLLEELHD